MIFDKTKAMRNAERHLAQGKIKAAIGEYKHVVDNDPKDFGTMNMLGDLHTKNSEKKEAVKCYTLVAEHYSKQGFAQKAIAIYNKISKLEPNSFEISAKLAELYKVKGSVKEAKSHYTTLAEHYQSNGRVIEALAIWKQIALLDPNNVEVYLTLAESYLKENQIDEAADAFAESGLRLTKLGNHETALTSFTKALDLKQDDPKILAGFVEAKFAQGKADEAAQKLSEILEKQPHNRDIRFLLIDCYIESHNIFEAEKAVIKLVEQEPANYPKLLDLARIYLKDEDLVSATRILAMSSEHMLVGGQAEAFHAIVEEILSKNPDQIDALRMLTRYCSWQRDDGALRDSLIRLALSAKAANCVDDERYALSQLVIILPHEVSYSARLKEINTEHGYDENEVAENLFEKQFFRNGPDKKTVPISPFADEGDQTVKIVSNDFVEQSSAFASLNGSHASSSKGNGHGSGGKSVETASNGHLASLDSAAVEDDGGGWEFPASQEIRLQKEVDSIKFYIESGYTELAEKAIGELSLEFGDCKEIEDLKTSLAAFSAGNPEPEVKDTPPVVQASELFESKGFDINDLRNELGLVEDLIVVDDSDYDTHYHTAVAYQEMGLTEEAIKEFQKAVALVAPNDGTRRFFSCSNLLGHCFMQKGMPNLALTWFQRTLETPNLSDDEKQGLWYELAGAYEAEGDVENAGKYFEQVYAENINFRDVSERVKGMAVNH
ncbi:MAG: tetratricopeptide repeat protein [Saprospiraceae bacterium]|nr:tetratricopeptide repeat protein [Pyrinomonadaceae bacterium]